MRKSRLMMSWACADDPSPRAERRRKHLTAGHVLGETVGVTSDRTTPRQEHPSSKAAVRGVEPEQLALGVVGGQPTTDHQQLLRLDHAAVDVGRCQDAIEGAGEIARIREAQHVEARHGAPGKT